MPTLAQLYAERQAAKRTAESSPEASNMAPWEKAAARVEAFEREQRMDPSTGVAGDVGRMVGVGLNQLADSGGYVLEKMGMERAGRWVQDKAQQRIQDLYGELTPEQQAANQLQFTRKENGEFGIGPAFTSPRALVGQVAASAPAMGFGMGLGGVVTRSLAAAGAGRAAAAGVGYGAGEGAIAGGLAGKDMVNEIRNAPIEALRGTEPFRLALESLAGDEGLSPENREALAREKVATAAYLETAGKVGLATAILSAPSGVMFDKMLRGAGLTRNAAPSLAKDLPLYMAGEGLQEFPQEGAESIISGHAAQKYTGADPTPWSEHFERAVAGGVTGAVTGGMMGGPAHVAGAMARRSAPPAPPENGAPQIPPSVDERTAEVVPQPTMEPEVLPPVEAGPRLALPAPAVTVTPDGTAVLPRQLDDMVNARLNAGGMSPEQVAASRRKLAGMEAPAVPVVPAKPAGALEKAANLAAPVPVVPEVVAPVSGIPAVAANQWDRLEQLAAQQAAGGVTDGVSDVQEEVGGQAQEVPAMRVPDVAPRKVRVKAAQPDWITFDVDGAEVTLAAGPNQSPQEFAQAVQEVAGLPISQAFVRLRERFGQAADVPGAQTVAGSLAEAPAAPAVDAGPNIGAEAPNIGAGTPNITGQGPNIAPSAGSKTEPKTAKVSWPKEAQRAKKLGLELSRKQPDGSFTASRGGEVVFTAANLAEIPTRLAEVGQGPAVGERVADTGEAIPAPEGKQPWEMTRNEWLKSEADAYPANVERKRQQVEQERQRIAVLEGLLKGRMTPQDRAKAKQELDLSRFSVRLNEENPYPPMEDLDVTPERHERIIKNAVNQGYPVPDEVLAEYPQLKPGGAAPAGNPLAVGDVFELDGVDYRIDSLDGGKVEAVDEDSGAVESWPNLEAFERQTGRRVVDRGTAVGESQEALPVADESQAVPEAPVVKDSLTTEPAATVKDSLTVQPEAPALVKVPTVYGESVFVRQRDLDGDKQILPMFTKDGNRRDNGVHRDNIDLDGSKRKAKADEIKDMPTFAVISAKGDKAFASAIAAQREVNRLGLKDSHEVVRSEVLFPGTKGYIGRRKGFDGTVPKGGRPQDRGARKATAEGAARVEAAQKRLREVMANKDIVGKQRADMVAAGRNLIQFLLTYADKDLETGFFKGDSIAYTQEDAPDGFRSFIYLDGVRAGEYGVERMPEARAEDAARTQREWKEQQEGFARVRAAEKRPSWPEFDDVLGRMEARSRKAGVLTDANEGDWRALAEGVARVEKSDVVSSAHAAEAISYLNAPAGKVSAEIAERKRTVFEAAGLPVPKEAVDRSDDLRELAKDIRKSQEKLDRLNKGQADKMIRGEFTRARTTTYNAAASNEAARLDDNRKALAREIRAAWQRGETVDEDIVAAAGSSVDYDESGNYAPVDRGADGSQGESRIDRIRKGLAAQREGGSDNAALPDGASETPLTKFHPNTSSMAVVEVPVVKQAESEAQDAGAYGVATHTEFFKRLADGDGTAAEIQANFQAVIDNKEAIVAELSGMKKDDLLNMLGGMSRRNYKNDKKDAIVRAVYEDMQDDFVLGRGYSYSLGAGSKLAAIKKIVDGLTDADVAAHAKSVEASRQEAKEWVESRVKAMADPQSLDDFAVYLRGKMADGMTEKEARLSLSPEQRTRFDALRAAESRKNRTERKTEQKATLQVAGQTVAGSIIETKHTKKGHDLFVVQLAERVERDDYNALNASAKKLGGYYSSFRGGGAVPGFQFTSREDAEAFVQLAGGDASAAKAAVSERMSAFEDDRTQGAAERLNAMADALEERADESLGRERKANTQRRAGMAARAEAAANADKALAQTMRNLSAAIESGDAEFLDRVREKKQVEYLTSVLRLAKWNEAKSKYPTQGERDRHENGPPTAETADYADYPTFTAFRSDLAALGRKLEGVEGLKQLGQRLLKVADDVTDAYVTFAKANLHKVSTFARKDGEAAMFASRQDAETAIARSGYKGQAIVLPVKRGQNLIVLSPAEARRRGVWEGDDDKRITLSADFGAELMEKLGRAAQRNRDLSVPWQFESVMDRRKMLSRMGIETAAEFRSALREFAGLQEQTKKPDRVKELERQMLGRKNDGLDFFPTPQSVADEMVAAADIQEGMAVLEPSAGWGHIAERIREAGFEPEVVELSNERKELLEAKGFNVIGRDFLEINPRDFTWGDIFRAKDGTEGRLAMTPGWELGSERVALKDEDGNALGYYDRAELEPVRKDGASSGYDRIVMNPPFSDRRDIQHVYHAYDLLKPGGRLVAIMSEGVFFGQDKKASAFRDWVEAVGGTDEKLEQGVFNDPSLPVNTGVAARMVVIDKQAGVEAPKFSVADRPSPRQQSVKFAEQVGRFLGGKMPGGQPLVVGHAPRVFLKLGVADRPMVMTQKNAAHVLEGKHGVDIETIKRLPELLDDPVAVLDSDTTDGAYVVVTTALHNGSPVVVAVHPDERIGRFDVHLVASVYGKDNGKWFGEQAGNLRYLDESKNLAMHMTAGVQFPMVRGARQGSGKTVLSPRDLVKYSGSGLSVAPASYLTGDSGLGDVSVAPARVLPFLRNVLDAEGLEAVSVTGGNVDALREVGKLFGKRIVFFRERDGGRAESGRGGRGEAPRSGRAVRHDAASGDLRRGTVNGFMLPSRPDVVYLNVNAPDPLLRVFGHELGHSLRVEDAALWGELVKGLQPLVRNWSDFKAAKGDARYANLSDDALAEELFGDVIGENFLNELFWRDMAQANEGLFKRVAKKAVALLSKALRALTGRAGVERFVSDMTQARAVVAKVLSQYGERAALGQYERFAKQEDSDYLSGRIDGKALLARMMEMGHSLEDIGRLVEGTRYAAESATVEGADTAKFSVAQTAQDRAKAQAAFAKTLTADRAGAVFKTLGSMLPERMKAAVGSVLSNPHYESRKSKWRGAAYELALERGANANEIKHEVMAASGDYAGLEGVRDFYRKASKDERAMLDKLLVEGDIRGEQYKEAQLASGANPLGRVVPESVRDAYLDFRQTLEMSNQVMFDRLGRLRLLPYEGSEFYQELIDLLDAGLSAEAVRRRFGINEKAVDAYMRIRADRKKLDEATKPYRDQPWHDTLRDAIVKGLGGLEMQNEFGKTPDLVAAFREIQKNGPLSIMTAEKFKKAQWYSILSDLLTQGDAHPMLKKLELYNAYLGVKEYDSQLAKLKDQWGQVKGYLPRIRKDGEQHVKVYRVSDDGTYVEVWMQPAKSVFGAKRLQAKVMKDLQGYIPHSFDPDAHYEVVVEPNTATPEEIFMGIGSHRAIEGLLSKVFDKATDAGLLENRLEVQNQVLRILADEISSRGFGRHKLHRAEHLIEGYETENTPAILAQFIGGMAGWLSKSEFAMRANKLMGEIPATRPEDKTWVREYVDDALKNSTWLDQWFGTARSFAALMYLGFKASSAILNATQNYVWGQAVLSKHTGGATTKLMKAQADVLRDHLLTRAGKAGVLTAEERWVLEEGLRRGRSHANYVRAMSGLDDNGGVLGKGQAGVRWLTEKAMIPFQAVETYWNREPALLAGYRVFRAQGLEKEAALKKAEKFVDDVHFVVSKENIPGLLRKMGPVGRTLYTFQSYSHNYLLGMFHAMKDGEAAVVMRSLTALVLFGGLAAVPFGDDLDKWYRRIFGERPLRMLEKWLTETAGEYTDFGDQIADFVVHGAPALAGVNFSRALGVNVSFLSAEDDTLAERLGGVSGGLAQKVKFAGMAAAKGDAYRAAEFMAPEGLANLMRSYRHYADGATTLSGRPVFGDDGKQVKYTAGEAVIRAFGFMPLRPSKQTEKRWDARLAREFWNDRKSDILAQWRRAPGDKTVLEQIDAYNRALRESSARVLVPEISRPVLRRALKAKPNLREMLF